MTTLKNIAFLSIMKNATRQNIKNIVKNNILSSTLGPNKQTELQTLRRLLKFLDLEVEYEQAQRNWRMLSRLRLEDPKANRNAAMARRKAAEKKMMAIREKAMKLRNKIGLHLYRNTVPFHHSTIKNAIKRIKRMRREPNNSRAIYNAMQQHTQRTQAQ